jgi:hypothetical protein
MAAARKRSFYRARPGQCVLPNRATRAAALSEARRRGTERRAQHRAAANKREQPGAAAQRDFTARERATGSPTEPSEPRAWLLERERGSPVV